MWVRLDGEPPLPRAGSLLTNVGLRIRGDVTTAPHDVRDKIIEVRSAPPREAKYRLVGRIAGPRDIEVESDRGSRHAGVEFVLFTGADGTGAVGFQVQADGWARDLRAGSRVAVVGRLELVSEYEWDAFELEESRADWLVKEVVPVDGDDVMLDLVMPSSERPKEDNP